MFGTRIDTFILHFLTMAIIFLMHPNAKNFAGVWLVIAVTLLVVGYTDDEEAEGFVPGDMYS